MAAPAGIGTEPVYGSTVFTASHRRFPDAIGHDYGVGDDGPALIRPDGYGGLLVDRTDPALLHVQGESHVRR